MRVFVQGELSSPGRFWRTLSSHGAIMFRRNPRRIMPYRLQNVAESSTSSQRPVKRKRKPKQTVEPIRWVSRSLDGRLITSTKTYEKEHVEVTVMIESSEDVDVLWGVYRASPDAWQFPKAVEALDTSMDDEIGAMCTPMTRQGDGTYMANFRIPQKLSPLTFAYALRTSSGNTLIPMGGTHFTVQIGIEPGKADVLGPRVHQDKIYFAVECQGAEYVNLVLVLQGENGDYTVQDVALDPFVNRTGTIWHASIKKRDTIVGYGWRVNGDLGWEQGYRVSPDAVLLDPEASTVVFADPCESLARFPHISARDGRAVVAFNSIVTHKMKFTRPHKVQGGMHGYGMLSLDPHTFGHDVTHVQHPGTFLGIAEASQYFVSLGVKSVVLRTPYVLDITNNRAVTYFAPDPVLASSPGEAEIEFRNMVDSLHTVGIEVLLSIDLTLTAEGSDEHPNPISWRGLDNAHYYRANGVLNCGNPVMQEHIIRALRHWTVDFGVDGFEFLYAENMIQNMDEVVMDAPSLPDALCHDAILSGTTLIASPHSFELLPRQGERGFPHWGRWRESNGDKGIILEYFSSPPSSRDPSLVKNVAAITAGRPHLFSPAYHGFPGNLSSKRPIGFSINDLDCSGWVDSVVSTAASVTRAAMLAEGQQDNVPTAASLTRAIIATTIFASGTPCFPFEALSGETEDFIRDCLTCRPILANILDSGSVGTWHATSGHAISLDDPSTFFLGRLVSSHTGTVYVAMNPEYHSMTVTLPSLAGTWRLVVDSYSGDVVPSGKALEGTIYTLPAKSFALFISQS